MKSKEILFRGFLALLVVASAISCFLGIHLRSEVIGAHGLLLLIIFIAWAVDNSTQSHFVVK